MSIVPKNISFLIIFTLILSACGTSSGKQEKSKTQSPPNIIFLMDDQHRHDVLGVVNPSIVTPTLDKLAHEGVRFSQATCQAPMCVPSRNSMMMSLYPNQVGVLRNGIGVVDSLLPAKPLAEVFREAGYETAGFGKTHWGSSRQPFTPGKRGFETRYIGECREEGAVMMIDVDPDKKARYTDEVKDYGGGEELPAGYIGRTSGIPEGDHRDGWVFDRCIDYIQNRNDERPLFLYLSFLKPHAAHNVPEGFEDLYNIDSITYAQQPPWDKDESIHAFGVNRRGIYEPFWKNATEEQWKEMTLRYYANCSWIDDMFGRTLAELDKKGLLENAIIVYVSDHGEMLGEVYYRFNKYCLYESSVRVPFIIAGSALPEKFKGTVDNRMVELVDVYPTLLEAAGVAVPETAQGINVLDENQDREATFSALHEKKGHAAFMARTQHYKLILEFNKKENTADYTVEDISGGEFYDLDKDPREWNNIYDETSIQEIQQKLQDEIFAKLKTIGNLAEASH